MVIIQTPFRMSFLGGGTDYRPYFEEYGGSVLSTTFDKYCYLSVRNLPPFFDYKSKLTYSKIEFINDLEEIKHPAVRVCLKEMQMHRIHLVYDADLPARSGLGSSSSFAVGLYHAIHTLRNETVSKMTLAKEAIHLEQELLKEAVGVQDQLAVAFGGLNEISFTSDGYKVKEIEMKSQRKASLNKCLLLFFTGFVRFSSEIAIEQLQKTKDNLSQLHEMKALVQEGKDILTRDTTLNAFGNLLNHSWQLKKSLSDQISNTAIDAIYNKAVSAGALGGKLLGAGNGGFLLLFVEPDKQAGVKKALSDFLHVPFKFENKGSHVLYHKK